MALSCHLFSVSPPDSLSLSSSSSLSRGAQNIHRFSGISVTALAIRRRISCQIVSPANVKVMEFHALCTTSSRNPNHIGFFAHFLRIGASRVSFGCWSIADCKVLESRAQGHGFRVQRRVCAMDDDFSGFSFDHWSDNDRHGEYMFSSSEGEDSDGDILLQPITDIDLPTSKERFRPSDDSITVTAHRLAMLGSSRKRKRTIHGFWNNVGLLSFSTVIILLVDQCAWRIVRVPLAPFHLLRPFLISVVLVSCAGYICVPLFRMFKVRSIVKNRRHSSKRGTPTMGGLYFVPIGLLVAEAVLKFSSIEVSGAAAATIAFAAIGVLDDYMGIGYKNDGLPIWTRVLLEVAIGAWFSYWLCTTKISTPYNMKTVVPLPAPLGLVCLGKLYPVLTSFCLVSMANGVNFTDGLDGLAAGTAALAFIGMSIVVLPICSDLSIFGASMAGACVGFLFQNQYKASIFMGDTGSLALGGALAAMASCTGMFFPLFISSGIFVMETLSVFIQVSVFQAAKLFRRRGYMVFRMAPFHHHLELCGIKEPIIVGAAYTVASLLILCAAYVGLSSA